MMKTSSYVPTYVPIWIRNSEQNLKSHSILVSFCWNVRNLTARKKIIMCLRIKCSANYSLNDIWANITCWNVQNIDRNQTGWSSGDFWRFWEKKLIVKKCDSLWFLFSFFFKWNLLLFVHFFRYICSTACECKHLLSQTYESNPVHLGI